jgi:hypothetical protein
VSATTLACGHGSRLLKAGAATVAVSPLAIGPESFNSKATLQSPHEYTIYDYFFVVARVRVAYVTATGSAVDATVALGSFFEPVKNGLIASGMSKCAI